MVRLQTAQDRRPVHGLQVGKGGPLFCVFGREKHAFQPIGAVVTGSEPGNRADTRADVWKSGGKREKCTLNDILCSLEVFKLLYNDQPPEGEDLDDGYRAHAKGVLTFDSESGFWLIHSVPRLAPSGAYAWPASGYTNGQSMLCVSLASSNLAEIGAIWLVFKRSLRVYSRAVALYAIEHLQLRIARRFCDNISSFD